MDKLFRLGTKGEFDASLCAKEIGDDRKLAFLHSREQQRRPTALDHAPMNFGNFEVRIDFSFNGNEILFTAQEFEEGTEISVHLFISLCPLWEEVFTQRSQSDTNSCWSVVADLRCLDRDRQPG